jgi:hypothetical protein
MTMMDIRKVRMLVRQRFVRVRMVMRLLAIPRKIMRVPVMHIVAVAMRMRHADMPMPVLVYLSHAATGRRPLAHRPAKTAAPDCGQQRVHDPVLICMRANLF